MGYVHDTNMSQFVGPYAFSFSAGTWTPTEASNVFSMDRTATDASFTACIPIRLMSNSKGLKGAYLKSIDVFYKIGTAAADAFIDPVLNKIVFAAATGTIPTGSAPAITFDTGHDTAAERYAVAEHKMTITLTTPVWVDDDDWYYVTITVDCAATTVFKFYGARANFTLRV